MTPSINDIKIAMFKKKEPNMLHVYCYGQTKSSIHQARIRIACSKLIPHLFHSHLTKNPSYAYGHPVADPTHFFLNCPRYAAIRIELVSNLALISRVTTFVLLYGNIELDIDEKKTYC